LFVVLTNITYKHCCYTMSMEDKSKLERLQEAIFYLKGKGIISKQQEIVEKMGYSKSAVSQALNGRENYFTDSFIKSFNKAFDNIFNEEYIIEGVGELLMKDEAKIDSNIRFLTLYDQLKRDKNIESNLIFCQIYNFKIEQLEQILKGDKFIEEIDFIGVSDGLLKYKEWIFTGKNSPFHTGEFNLIDDGRIRVIHLDNGMVMMHKNAWEKVQKSLMEYGEYLDSSKNGTLEVNKEEPLATFSNKLIQTMIEERKRCDEMNTELIRQNKDLIELLKKTQSITAQQDDNADYAAAK